MGQEYAKPYSGEKGTYAYHIDECHRLWQEFFQSRAAALAQFCAAVDMSVEELKRKSERTIVFHDAGKLLPTFQQQMQRLIDQHPPDPALHFRHELASALLIFVADREMLMKDETLIPYDLLAILGHHKTLQYDWHSFERERFSKNPPGLSKQAILRILQVAQEYGVSAEIDIDRLNSMFASSRWASLFLRALQDRFELTELDKIPSVKRRNIRLVYAVIKGLLMTCDWMASATDNELQTPLNHTMTSRTLREKIIEKLKQDGRTYEERPFHAACEQTSGDVLAIAPTGAGKTEAALLWATNCEPTKIIFLMPTMVTSNSLFKRMQENYFEKKECGLIHSGADTFFAQQDELEQDNTPRDFRLAMRQHQAFIAPVMVATVDQILTSGFNIGSWCQKEWALVGSRVIFDEIHAYQPYTLGLVTAAIEKIKLLSGSVCLMSATMPSFLREHFQRLLGISSPIEATELMVRQKCNWEYRDAGIDTMTDEIQEHLRNGKKVAIVFNTVRAAQMAYRKWRDILGEERVLCYHSQFTMKDRQDKEDQLLQKDGLGRPQRFDLVITTQAIEVSLDISFDVMYSECAPLDSLIQRAGRCNRYNAAGDYYFIVFPISDIAYNKVYEKARNEIDRTIEIITRNQKCLREDELGQMLEYVYSDSRLGKANPEFQEGYRLYDKIATAIDGQGFIFDLPLSEEMVTRDFRNNLKVSIIPQVYYEEVLKLWERKQYPLIRRYEVPVSEWRRQKLRPVVNKMHLPIYVVPYSKEEGVIDSKDDLPFVFI